MRPRVKAKRYKRNLVDREAPSSNALTAPRDHSTMVSHHDPKGHPPPMNARTQNHLSNQQRQALQLLLADQSASDLVRQAVDRLLSDELAGDDWGGCHLTPV
jgi:hypothetical protein